MKRSLVTLAIKIFYKFLIIFGTVNLQSYKIARKSIYDIFDSLSLHWKVKFSLHVPQNNINEIILIH